MQSLEEMFCRVEHIRIFHLRLISTNQKKKTCLSKQGISKRLEKATGHKQNISSTNSTATGGSSMEWQ